ncbi:cupin-like domain-containing protein [Marinimicrobium sp. C2-29]|uniref:cupin-like domain-containing protein n=1 Tax=Marinimicrobium sp. C2-29 TaxID=3139825 RepID=UPI0031389DEC
MTVSIDVTESNQPATPGARKVVCWSREKALRTDFEQAPPEQPVLLKGYASHWPIVDAARRSPEAVARYLLPFDAGKPLEAMIADPREQGRLFYSQDLSGFNFTRMKGYLPDALSILASQSGKARPAAFYVGSTSIPEYLPGLEAVCRLPGISPDVIPNLWMGNSTRVATHNDAPENIACVAAGRRRFTLFPPDQEENLYIADTPHTPGGRPISLVDLRAPDLDRFPRFTRALETAQVADLEPGDALYLPRHWWHNVEAFGPLNILINFWW